MSRFHIIQGPSLVDDFGLATVAQHNATIDFNDFASRRDDAKGLGIYDGHYQESQPRDMPTPRSHTEAEGMRTRSGRSTRRTQSPASTPKSCQSKSPASKIKKEKKSKVLERAKMPKLTAPLSVLTKDLDVPVKDMDAWVNRSLEVRREEAEKRNGYVTRPMNSFMLYRSAYADRTKQWATQNNHQVVSSVAGESWPMEPEEVRNQFNEWAKIERANHAAAHPEYKFSPSKNSKKRKGDFSDDEDDGSDLNGDPDGEYRGSRTSRPRKLPGELTQLNEPVGFDSDPYYSHAMQQYVFANAPRTLTSNVAYDTNGLPFDPQTGVYIGRDIQPQFQSYSYTPEARLPSPISPHGGQSMGGFGLPGQLITADDFFNTVSRTATPGMQNYSNHSMPHYQPQQNPGYYHSLVPQQIQHLNEHQQYLHAASQPQIGIDPRLDAAMLAAGMAPLQQQQAFGDAMAGMNGGTGFLDMPEYFEEQASSPNQTLAPRWDFSAAEFGS